jgi:hypothetical protein
MTFGLLIALNAHATCPPDVSLSGQLTCSSSVTGEIDHLSDSLLGGECSDLECYTCGEPYQDEKQVAPEDVYSFSCQQTGTVLMKITDLTCDMDIYVLDDSCDPNAGCLFGSTAAFNVDDEVSFSCSPGQNYYIVIEAYGTDHLEQASGPCLDGDGNVYSPTYTLFFDVSESTGCAEDCNDGIDNDLDGDTDCDDTDCWTESFCCDIDEDGYFALDCLGSDCDDTNEEVYPNAPEGINGNGDGIDNDCDDIIDEGTNDFDDDGDGTTENEGDCDDNDPSINQDSDEIPGNDVDENCDDCIENVEIEGDGLDNDCDGLVDEDDNPPDDESFDTAIDDLEGKDSPSGGCSCSSTSEISKGYYSFGLLMIGFMAYRRRY